MKIFGTLWYLWSIGGRGWASSTLVHALMKNRAGRCERIASQRANKNRVTEKIETMEPNLAIKFHPM